MSQQEQGWVAVVDGCRPRYLPETNGIGIRYKSGTADWYENLSASTVSPATWGIATHYTLTAPPAESNAAPLEAKKPDFVCACGSRYAAWSGQSNCVCGRVMDFDTGASKWLTPRWVPCSERLPAEGRVVRAKTESWSDWEIRRGDDGVYYRYPGLDEWRYTPDIHQFIEWLDEAPAQEGPKQNCGEFDKLLADMQRESSKEMAEAREWAKGIAEQIKSEPPPGYLTPAQRQLAALRERGDAIRELRAMFGGVPLI